MNDILKLINNKEVDIISSLSIIEYRYYSVKELFDIFQIDIDDELDCFETLHNLSNKKYLIRNKYKYIIDYSIRQFIIDSDIADTERCSVIINYFYNKLEKIKLPISKNIIEITKQIEILLQNVKKTSLNLANLMIRLYSRYIKTKDYVEALKLNKQAIKILKKIDNNHPRLAFCYRDTSYIYRKLGNVKKALKYSKKDIYLLEAYSNKYDYLLSDSYQNISKNYEATNEFDNAIVYSNKALSIEKRINKKFEKSNRISFIYSNLSYYYSMYGDYESAVEYVEEAIKVFDKSVEDEMKSYKVLLKNKKYYNLMNKAFIFIDKYRIFILSFFIILIVGIISFIVSLFF